MVRIQRSGITADSTFLWIIANFVIDPKVFRAFIDNVGMAHPHIQLSIFFFFFPVCSRQIPNLCSVAASHTSNLTKKKSDFTKTRKTYLLMGLEAAPLWGDVAQPSSAEPLNIPPLLYLSERARHFFTLSLDWASSGCLNIDSQSTEVNPGLLAKQTSSRATKQTSSRATKQMLLPACPPRLFG